MIKKLYLFEDKINCYDIAEKVNEIIDFINIKNSDTKESTVIGVGVQLK